MAISDYMGDYKNSARLLADIGGTNARFALELAPHRFSAVNVLACKSYDNIAEAINAYLSLAEVRVILGEKTVHHAAIAIATPVDGDAISMVNHHWRFSIEALRTTLGLSTLLVANDFTALAMALPYLSDSQRIKIGGGEGALGRPLGLIGAGTGLGVAGLVPVGDRWVPLASEGGHATFAAADATQAEVLRVLQGWFGHVSAERLLSGAGLESIYRALSGEVLSAEQITNRALEGSCNHCVQTVECFCTALGSVAGNVALTLGATGGMYIGGGIVPRLGELFFNSAFRSYFENKGRFKTYLSKIPTYLITEQYPAFIGVSAMLEDRLAANK